MTEKIPDRDQDLSLQQPDGVLIDHSDGTMGRRKEQLSNGEHHISGGVFITPDAEIMPAIERETDGKVTYFPARELPSDAVGGVLTGEPLFYQAIFEPLCEELIRRYPGRKLALRAIMTSVNGTLKDAMGPDADILDITETVSHGVEKSGEVFNVQGMATDRGGDVAAMGLKYISTYTSNVGYTLKYEAGPDGQMPTEFSEAVFPAILVYDAEGLEATSHDRFSAKFREGRNPQDVILGAYVLDKL